MYIVWSVKHRTILSLKGVLEDWWERCI